MHLPSHLHQVDGRRHLPAPARRARVTAALGAACRPVHQATGAAATTTATMHATTGGDARHAIAAAAVAVVAACPTARLPASPLDAASPLCRSGAARTPWSHRS